MPNKKVLYIADTHCGIADKDSDIIWAMQKTRQYAYDNGIEVVMHLGDLFHDRVALGIDTINTVYNFFYETKHEYNQEWVIFPGNHDMFLKNSWKMNSLHPLKDVLTVIEDVKLIKYGGRRFWVVPFIHYEEIYMQVINEIEKHHEEGDVLLTHIGVRGALLNECFQIKNWSYVDFTGSKFKDIFTGHFHCHQETGKNVMFVGSPIPFNFNEGFSDHGFVVHDLETNERELVSLMEEDDAPPKFMTITDEDLDDLKQYKGSNIRVVLTKQYSDDEKHQIVSNIRESGALLVKTMSPKEKDDELDAEVSTTFKLMEDNELFEKFMEHDQPESLNQDLLKELNLKLIDETHISEEAYAS